jgi:hypothetical protein
VGRTLYIRQTLVETNAKSVTLATRVINSVHTRMVAGLSQKALSSGMTSCDIVVLEGWDPRVMTARLGRDRRSYCGGCAKDVLRTCVRMRAMLEFSGRIFRLSHYHGRGRTVFDSLIVLAEHGSKI